MPWGDADTKRMGILIMKLGSEHDGEILATVRAIRKHLAIDGTDLHDLARRLSGEPTIVYRTAFREPPKSDWQMKADYCVDKEDLLRAREAEFVRDMAIKLKFQDDPTDKQAAWLESIYQRLKREYHETA